MYHILCIDIKGKIMKLNKVILLLAFVLIISPAIAYDITEETTTPEYLINHGYSALSAEHVQLEKARAENREYKTLKYRKWPWWKKVWAYIDLGVDDDTLLQHNINPSQSFGDW